MENFDKIDELLERKSFDELSENERALVLEHYTQDEYNAVRVALQQVQINQVESEIEPPAGMKNMLVQQFEQVHQKERLVWYNKLWFFLFPADKSFFKKPAFQLAFASLAIVLGGFLVTNLMRQNNEVLAKVDQTELKTKKQVSTSRDSQKPVEIDANQQEEIEEKEITGNTLESKKLSKKEVEAEADLTFEATFSSDKDVEDLKEDAKKIVHFDAMDKTTAATIATEQPMQDEVFLSVTTAGISNKKSDLAKGTTDWSSQSVSMAEEPDLLDLLNATY